MEQWFSFITYYVTKDSEMVPLTAIQHGIFAIKKQTRFYPTLIKLPSDLINLLNLNVDNFKIQIVRLV